MKKLTVLFVLPLLAFTPAPAEAESADNPQQQRGWLGVYTENLSEAMLVALDIDHGVLIADVADESPAAAVGFEKGDVVVELDGRQIEGASDLRYVVRDRPGRKVVVQIRRRGRPARIDVTLMLGIRTPPGLRAISGCGYPRMRCGSRSRRCAKSESQA
jgi:S1-C subfamily serine protease